LRRIIASCTAAVALIAAGAAYAAVTNTYTASATFSPSKAGTKAKPVAVGITIDQAAHGSGGNRSAVLTELGNTFYGVQSNGKLFPVCTPATINNAQSDSGCPKGSLIGTGTVHAVIGPSNNPAAPGTQCTKTVNIYNAGQGKLSEYLFGAPIACGGIGFLPAYPATITVSGGTLKIDVPVPGYITHAVPSVDGSLTGQHIVYKKLVSKGHGFFESVGCKSGKRAYTTFFVANGVKSVIPGSAKCTK
jgi:hypothetical protein